MHVLHPEDGVVVARLYAAAITLYAFWLYNQKTGKISAGTWWILATGDTLDLASYWGMTEQWEKAIVPAAFAGASILTFGYALVKRRFAWPDKLDWGIITLDILITVAWYFFTTAAFASLLYQATAVLAFIPMYRGLLENREEESLSPWALWSIAHLIFFVTAALEYKDWEEMAYPLSGLITHWTVFLLELRRRTKISNLTRPPH